MSKTVVNNEAANFTVDMRKVLDKLITTFSASELIQALCDVVNNTVASMKMTAVEVVNVLQLAVDTVELCNVMMKS